MQDLQKWQAFRWCSLLSNTPTPKPVVLNSPSISTTSCESSLWSTIWGTVSARWWGFRGVKHNITCMAGSSRGEARWEWACMSSKGKGKVHFLFPPTVALMCFVHAYFLPFPPLFDWKANQCNGKYVARKPLQVVLSLRSHNWVSTWLACNLCTNASPRSNNAVVILWKAEDKSYFW